MSAILISGGSLGPMRNDKEDVHARGYLNLRLAVPENSTAELATIDKRMKPSTIVRHTGREPNMHAGRRSQRRFI